MWIYPTLHRRTTTEYGQKKENRIFGTSDEE